MSEEVLEEASTSLSPDPKMTESPKRRRLLGRGLGVALIVVSLLLAYYLVIAYLGWQSGQQLLQQSNEQTVLAEINNQKDLAELDLSEGRYALAERRMIWVLERRPEDGDARLLQQRAQAGLSTLLTPMPPATPTPVSVPTATPTATPTPLPIESPNAELQRLRRLKVAESWETLVPALLNFQRQFPNYERQETDQLLYDAYIAWGVSLVTGDEVEQGLFYLSQAERLGDLPQEILDYETWAELYLQGVAFYGTTNWGASAYYFRDLCLAAPFYQSSCDRLHEVLILYGDQYVATLDWCPALALYDEALLYSRTTVLVDKRSQAEAQCFLATPTPTSPTVTNTVPLTTEQQNSFFLPGPGRDG